MTWNYAYTPYLWPMLASAVFLAALGVYSACRRNVPGALSFAFFLLFAMLWSLGAILQLAAVDSPTKIFWFKFQSVWKLPAATTELCFSLMYAHLGRWLTRRNLALLAVLPLLVFFLAFTNDLHHLLWRGFSVEGIVHPLRNSLIWVFGVYSNLLALGATVVLIRLFIRLPLNRWPVALILSAQILLHMTSTLDLAGVNPFAPMDPTVMVWNAGAVLYAIALFGFRMFDLIPLASKAVIKQMRDGMLVLDPQGRVASLNPAAEQILGGTQKQVQGKPIGKFFPMLPDLRMPLRGVVLLSKPFEICMVLGPKQRYYELDFSPLHDSRGVPVGYLLLIRDVTAQKETQAQILEQQRTLAVLNDREQVARELHDELSQELAFINTQAQAVAHSLAAGQTTQAEARLQRLAQVAREVQVDVRGQINKLSFTVSPGDGLLGALRQFLEAYKRVFDIPAELVLNEALPEIVLEPIAEMQLLRITQEAFTNIRKHAHAQHVRVYLDRQDQAVELSIEDDGVGFDPRQRKADSPTFGLGIMADRAKEIGASFQVSSRCGQGTRVTVRVPATPIKKGSSG